MFRKTAKKFESDECRIAIFNVYVHNNRAKILCDVYFCIQD